MDEPLQNLDAPTAQRLCRYLTNLKGGRTVVVIMHSDELDRRSRRSSRYPKMVNCMCIDGGEKTIMNTRTKYKFQVPSSFVITKKNVFLIVGSVLSTALSVATSLALGSIVSAVSQGSWMTDKTIAFVGVLFLSLVSAVLVLTFKGWFPVRAAIIQRMSCTTQVIQRVIAMPARVYKNMKRLLHEPFKQLCDHVWICV